jgi:CheY-like chemotaxis protein
MLITKARRWPAATIAPQVREFTQWFGQSSETENNLRTNRVESPANKWIVIVDDQPSDQHMLARILDRLGVGNPVLKLTDGHEAIRYLNGDGPYADRAAYPLPAVMFLDLKLPVVSGWEVLDWILALSLKRDFLLFVYSEIRSVSDVRRVYALGTDSYVAKPVKEIDIVNLLHHFPKPWQFKPDHNPT